MAISVEHIRSPGFPKEDISWEGIEVTDQFRVAWEDRIIFAKEVVGFAVGGILNTPEEYDFGDEPIANIFATKCDISPIVGFAADGNYKYVLCTVTYRNRSFDIDSPQGGTIYASESIEGSSEFLSISKEGLFWDAAGTANAVGDSLESPSVIIKMVDWVYTLHNILGIPEAVWTMPGKVNNSSLFSSSLQKLFPAETLLMDNPTLVRKISQDGNPNWDITFRFAFKDTGWNLFPRPSAGSTDLNHSPVYGKAGAGRFSPYKTADFTQIIIT